MLDQNGDASGSMSRFYVFPSITDHEARWQVDAVPDGRVDQETRTGLATRALVTIVMVADEQVIQRQRGEQRRIDGVHDLPALCPASDVWLVRDPDEEQAGRLEIVYRARGIGHHLQFG